MAVTTGSDYDHITISDGTNQVVHYLKDATARTAIGNLEEAVPNAPSTDGYYLLSCTVVNGVPTYAWVYAVQ